MQATGPVSKRAREETSGSGRPGKARKGQGQLGNEGAHTHEAGTGTDTHTHTSTDTGTQAHTHEHAHGSDDGQSAERILRGAAGPSVDVGTSL